MASRKQSKKKKKKKDNFASKKKIDSEGFDFVALVAGMVTTLLFLFLVVGHFASRNAAARAIAEASAGDTGKVILALDTKTFDDVLRRSEAEDLFKILEALNDLETHADPNVEFGNQQRRIDTANAMLSKVLGESKRQSVVLTKIDALLKAYVTDLENKLEKPNLAGNLRNCAKEYSDDSKLNVSRAARLARFKLEAFEVTKAIEPSIKPVVKQVENLLKRYPFDETVHNEIRGVVDYYLAIGRDKIGTDLVKRIQFNREKFTDLSALEFVDGLSDYIMLEQADYQRIFDERITNGEAGKSDLLKATMAILKESNAGQSLIRKVDEVAHWFEQIDLEQANEIYTELSRRTVSYQIAGVPPLAQRISEAGLKRTALFGQPFELGGVTLEGKKLKPEITDGKLVVIVFWSKENPASITELTRFYVETLAWPESEVAVLAVCIDERPGEVAEIGAQVNRFHVIINDPVSKENLILSQSPSVITPRAMIVGSDGVVARVNVPMSELKASAELILSGSAAN